MDPTNAINEFLKGYNKTSDYTYKKDAEIYQTILMSPDNKEALSEFMNIITRNEKYDLNSFLAETTNQMQKTYNHMQVINLLSAASPISTKGPVIEIQDDYICEDYDEE